jgi:hypothetical protein
MWNGPIPAVVGLRDATEIYSALAEMLEQAGCSLPDLDQNKIAAALGALDPALNSAFLAAPDDLEKREEQEIQAAELKRKETLKPFRAQIDRYVKRFSDQNLRLGWGTQQGWAKRFIEDYVIAHGDLPTGKHKIEVAGYHGSEHDFTDMKTA